MARLLILEDDLIFATQLRTDLEERGYEVAVFGTATEALDHATSNVFDLAISDLMVEKDGVLSPDGGIKFIAHLRQIQNMDVPIIAISGSFKSSSGETFTNTAKTVGANATIAKPFLPDELAATIDKLLVERG